LNHAVRYRAAIRPYFSEPASQPVRRIAYLIVTIACVAAWIAHAASGPPVFPVDDAYITAQNARVFAGATDVSYGVSSFVGATSPLHLLLVGLASFVMAGSWALHTVMWLAITAYALGLARLAFVHKASLAVAIAFVVAGCFAAEAPHQLLNGLETGLALAALTWVLALAAERHRATAILCGLLPFIRPELVAVSGLVMGVLAYEHWRARERPLQRITRDFVVAAAVALPLLVLLWVTTGAPVPTSVGAKRYWFAEGCLDSSLKWQWVRANAWDFLGMCGVLSTGIFLLTLTKLGRVGLLFIVILLVAYYREFPGALAHFDHRYLYVVLPFLLFGVISAIDFERVLVRRIAVGIVVLSAVMSLASIPMMLRRRAHYTAFTQEELATVSSWAHDFIPPGSRILIHDAGFIAYATDFPLVDVVGLKRPKSAAIHKELTWPTCGRDRGEAIHRIAMDGHAEYLVVLREWDGLFHITRALRRHGWGVEKLRSAIDRGYEVYKLTAP
jgi:hypothetical protein